MRGIFFTYFPYFKKAFKKVAAKSGSKDPLPDAELLCPDIASTRAKRNATVEFIDNSASFMVPRHRLKRAKFNANVEFIASLGINHGTLISPQRVQNTMHTLNL